jgi:hypothetical protein
LKAICVIGRAEALPASAGATALPPSTWQGGDSVQQFLSECTVEDPRGHMQARVLSTRFAEWAWANDAPAMTEHALAMYLEALDVQKQRGRLYIYLGLRLSFASQRSHQCDDS